MPSFEYEIMRRIELTCTVILKAKNEEEADVLVNKILEEGGKGLDEISVTFPKNWDVADDHTDYQLR